MKLLPSFDKGPIIINRNLEIDMSTKPEEQCDLGKHSVICVFKKLLQKATFFLLVIDVLIIVLIESEHL